MSHKIESYNERSRSNALREKKEKELLESRENEIDLFKKQFVKEFVELQENKNNFKDIILGIFRSKK